MKISDIFDLTNILLLAIAVLIFFRLRSVLGRRTGNERPRLDPLTAREAGTPRDNVVTLPRSRDSVLSPEAHAQSVDDRLGKMPEDSKALLPLREIAAADPNFETGSFLAGAKVAYEMIVTAYAKGDRETLGNLLSREVYDSFNAVISEREARGETVEMNFVGITSADIVDAHLSGRVAQITVRFVSELITAVHDRTGEIVEGDLKTVRQVIDIWTFMRDLSSANPNWRLVATDSQ